MKDILRSKAMMGFLVLMLTLTLISTRPVDVKKTESIDNIEVGMNN